jgi:hypothetical protein
MCGFTDVRKREDGEYHCPICLKKLGKDFDKKVMQLLGKEWHDKLKKQEKEH